MIIMNSRWRHVKRGTEYRVVDLAGMQSASHPEIDDQAVVIYEGENGRSWVRLVSEFMDGRFEPIDDSARWSYDFYHRRLDDVFADDAYLHA